MSFGVTLFGVIPLGVSGGGNSYERDFSEGRSSNSISVTFKMPEETNPNSALDQRAFVIGAAVDCPGAKGENEWGESSPDPV